MSPVGWTGQVTGEAPEVTEIPDLLIYPLLTSLADCLCVELALSPGGEPCFCGVVPASLVAMDFCDCAGALRCGMAYVRLDTVFPSRRFPDQTTDARCTDPLAARVHIGVTRCLPGMDTRGNPPGVVEQSEAVRVQMGDMAAIRRTIECCFDDGRAVLLGAYTPVGDQGNCGGGFWSATVQVWP